MSSIKLFYFLCVYIFRFYEDTSRFNYKYNKLCTYYNIYYSLQYLLLITIFITHYISQINYSAKTCACMKMIRERIYSHVIRGSLSYPGSVFYLMGRFHILCTDSGSGFLTVILDVDFMYLVRVAIWILLIHVILNASFIHI